MGGGKSVGSSQLPLAVAATTVVEVIVTILVVGLVGPAASKAGSLVVCQWARTGSSKVLGEMDLTWVLEEETLVRLSETGSERGKGRGMEGGTFLCQTKTRVETLAPMELEGVIPETKRGADGVSLGAKQERLELTVTQTTTPYPRVPPLVLLVGYLSPQC